MSRTFLVSLENATRTSRRSFYYQYIFYEDRASHFHLYKQREAFLEAEGRFFYMKFLSISYLFLQLSNDVRRCFCFFFLPRLLKFLLFLSCMASMILDKYVIKGS